MRTLKTTLPDNITTLDQAKAYLTALHSNEEHYHPDDDATDCLDISEQEGQYMNALMDKVFEVFTANSLDVYKFLLDLDGHIIED